MENALKALKALGLSDTDIEALKSEKLPEGFNIDEVVNNRVKDLITIHVQNNPPNYEEIKKESRLIGAKDIKQKIGREVFKMEGISRADLEKMDNEEFIKMASQHLTTMVEKAGSGTDENLKKEVSEYKQKFLKVTDELDDLKKSSQHAIEQAKNDSETRVKQFKIDALREKLLGSYEYGIQDKTQLGLALDGVRSKLNSAKWRINPDTENGDLSGEKDGDLAINFEGNGHFKTLKDATDYLVAPLLKRSNAGSEVIKKGAVTVETSSDVEKKAVEEVLSQFQKN